MIDLKNESVLVTGAGGFIGLNLVKRLLSDGAKVHAIVKPDNLNNLILQPNVKIHKIDMSNRKDVINVVTEVKPRYVFHLAASLKRDRDPAIIDKIMDINFHGTLNLLDAIKDSGIERFIFPSTADVYGSNKSPFTEDQPVDPINPYSLSKAAAELACKMYFKTFGLPVVILRSFQVYGPHQKPNMLIPEIVMSALNKKEFKMTKGEQKRDFVFIDDVVNAFIRSCEYKNAIGEIINLGSGKGYRIVDVVEKIMDLMNHPIKPSIGALPYRTNEVWEMYCNNSKAKNVLDWVPQTTLDDGLKKTIKWYMGEHHT